MKRASIRPPGIPAPWEKWARRGSGSGRSFSMADAVSQCASFLMRQSQLQGAASECGAPEIQKARQLRICCIFWLRLRERASPAPSRALTALPKPLCLKKHKRQQEKQARLGLVPASQTLPDPAVVVCLGQVLKTLEPRALRPEIPHRTAGFCIALHLIDLALTCGLGSLGSIDSIRPPIPEACMGQVAKVSGRGRCASCLGS